MGEGVPVQFPKAQVFTVNGICCHSVIRKQPLPSITPPCQPIWDLRQSCRCGLQAMPPESLWGRSLCVVTLGVSEEAQTTQRFGITKSVGCTFVGETRKGHVCWGEVREERVTSSFKGYGIRVQREAGPPDRTPEEPSPFLQLPRDPFSTLHSSSYIQRGKSFPLSFPNWRTVARLRRESLGLGSLAGRRKRNKPDKFSKENDEGVAPRKTGGTPAGKCIPRENRANQFQSWRESTTRHSPHTPKCDQLRGS